MNLSNGICSIHQQTHLSTNQSKMASYAPPTKSWFICRMKSLSQLHLEQNILSLSLSLSLTCLVIQWSSGLLTRLFACFLYMYIPNSLLCETSCFWECEDSYEDLKRKIELLKLTKSGNKTPHPHLFIIHSMHLYLILHLLKVRISGSGLFFPKSLTSYDPSSSFLFFFFFLFNFYLFP